MPRIRGPCAAGTHQIFEERMIFPMKNLCNRVVSLLLTAVMLFGMLPAITMPVSAGGVQGAAGSHPTKPGGSSDAVAWANASCPFTRFTLVHFPDGINGESWSSYKTVASIDILAKGAPAGTIEWYDSNALDYAAAGWNEADGHPALLDQKIAYRGPTSTGPGGGWNAKRDDGQNNIGILDQDAFFIGEYAISGTVDMAARVRALGSDTDPILSMFVQDYSKDKPYGDSNEAFNYLLDTLFKGSPNTDSNGVPFNGADYSEYFNHDKFGGTYRVLVEPGAVLKDNSSHYYALTVRDFAALSFYLNETNADDDSDGSFDTLLGSQYFDDTQLVASGWAVYTIKNEFYDYKVLPDGTIDTSAVTAESSGLWRDSAGESGDHADLYEKIPGTNSSKLTSESLREAVFGSPGKTDLNYGSSWQPGELAGYGLGILAPWMLSSNSESTGLTVSKTVSGDTADSDKKWQFVIKANYEDGTPVTGPVNAHVENATASGDAPQTFSDEGKSAVTLGNGESVTFKFDINEEHTSIKYSVTEEGANEDGYVTTVKLNGAEVTLDAVTGTITVSEGATAAFANTKAEGDAHLIIDYNIPGAQATTSGDPADTPNTVDCGYLSVGKELTLTPRINGTDLTGQEGTYKLQMVDGTCSTCGGTVKVHYVYQGLFKEAEGGEKLDLTQKYKIEHPGLTILYAQWKPEIEITCSCSTPTPPIGGGGGGGPTGHPENLRSELRTIYWDENYDGAGITSAWYGWFEIWHKLDHCELTCSDDYHSHTFYEHRVEDWTRYIVELPFSQPTDPIRKGYTFLGWYPYWTNNGKSFHKLFHTHTLEEFMALQSEGLGSIYNPGQPIIKKVPGQFWPVYTTTREYNTLLPEAYRPGGSEFPNTDRSLKHGVSYYALWLSDINVWYAMGGDLYSYQTNEKITSPTQGVYDLKANEAAAISSKLGYWINSAKSMLPYADGTGRVSYAYEFPGQINATDTYNALCGLVPQKTGYVFRGWYYEPACRIPLNETEDGIIPGRAYFAGYDPQRVIINYYDTREGTQLLMQQEALYGDVVSLPDIVQDTYGWHSVGWTVKPREGDPVTPNSGQRWTNEYILSIGGQHFDEGDPTASSDLPYYEVNLYADYSIKTVDYTVTIDWDDFSDNDGVRPQSLDIRLVSSDGNVVVRKETAVTGTGDTWSVTFEDLPTTISDVDTERANYWFYVAGYTDGITGQYVPIADTEATSGEIRVATPSDYGTDAATTYTYAFNRYTVDGDTDDERVAVIDYTGHIQMCHNLITTGDDIKWTIQWDDDSDRDGIRPQAITLQLYDAAGNEVTAKLKDGDFVENSGRVSLNPAICEVSEDGNTWTYIFKDYQKYTNGGKLAGYKVGIIGGVDTSEYSINYLAGDPFMDTNGVILHHDIYRADVPFTINWDDFQNRDGQRPKEVEVSLRAYQWNRNTSRWEEMLVENRHITGNMTADAWVGNFRQLPVNSCGEKIIYRLSVISDLNAHIPPEANEYSWVEGLIGNPVSVDISHNINRRTVEAVIAWDDNGNNDNIRPTNVVLQLYAHEPNGTPVAVEGQAYRVTLTGDPTADNWNYTFKDVPKFVEGKSGVELIYTVQVHEVDGDPLYGYYIITANGEEEEVLRYEAHYLKESVDLGDGALIDTLDPNESDRAYVRLKHISETKTMNFSVDWHDSDDRDNIRPDSVSVDLYKTVGNGTPIYLQTIYITAGKNGTWTYKLEGLPGYEDGQSVNYTIEVPADMVENLASIGYTTTTQDNIVHLYYTPATGSISTKLYWSDNEDNDGYRPDSVVVELYKNGMPTGKTVDLNATNNWSATWNDLDVHYVEGTATGTDVVYSVKVEAPAGYTVTYNPESTTIEEGQVLLIQLSHAADLADVPVTVYWTDNSNVDGKRPEQLKVMLLADGENSQYNAVLTAENAIEGNSDVWNYTFKDLPVYRGDGEKIYYSVIVYDDAAWKGEYSSLTAGTTLYLNHAQLTSSLYVSFQFNDNHNADGGRMEGLYLQLTADGTPVDTSEYKHTVSFDTHVDGYTWAFGDLPIYRADGKKIKYNVAITFDPEFGATDYSVWTSSDIELSEDADASVNQVIVRLSKKAATTARTGYIYWFDANDVCGERPDELSLSLQNNYSDTRITYTVNAKTGEVTNRTTGSVVGEVSVKEWTGDSSVWTYTITDLPASYINSAGESAPIYYYVTANTSGIAAYYPTVYTGIDYGMDVTLTHRYYEQYCKTAAQDYSVTLMWLDNANAWGYRPNAAGVKLELLANGEVYDTVYLTEANAVKGNENAWTIVFKDLPTYRGGSGILWSVRIADVPSYTQSANVSTATASTITYTQTVGFHFTVNWADSDNDDLKRPENVTLTVVGDGTEAGSVTMTGTGNQWTGDISDLPVWRESDPDKAVHYTFLWADGTETALANNRYTAAPTMNGAPVESENFYYLSAAAFGDNEDAGYNDLDSSYEWETNLSYNKEVADYYFSVSFSDDTDRDGIRPADLAVNLLADGVVVDSRTLTIDPEESAYSLTWEDMEVWENGKNIVYTIEVAGAPKGYTVSYNENHTAATLTHEVELVDVTGTLYWDDSTQLNAVYNANGTYIRGYEQIARADASFQLIADGVPMGESKNVTADFYGTGEKLEPQASVVWTGLYKNRDHGTPIDYSMEVSSDGLTALLGDGHSLTYDFEAPYDLKATVSHDLYDIRGKVYYMYSYSEDFLRSGAAVTAYLYNPDTEDYSAEAATVTGDDGTFELRNLPQGLYIIRATYVYGDNPMAGAAGVELDREDADTTVLINRDAAGDADYYLYSATGKAFYQTDITDDSTITAVPDGSVALLYKVVDGKDEPEYVGMTTTKGGAYTFSELTSADYLVNVVFNYDNGVYTYDNGDALADGLSFLISGADMVWPDIVKQVNGKTEIIDPDQPPVNPDHPEPKPEPCVTHGSVFYSDNGVHTTEPIEDVDVYVYLAANNVEIGHDTTDANGYWEVEGLAPADYIAVFSYQGNASRVLLFTITDADYEVGKYEAAPQYFDREVETPTGTIRGIVLDENGDSRRALVAIYDKEGNLSDFAYTDTFGFYQFTMVAGYDYQVRILAVEDEVTTLEAGDPDDSLTTLDYYTLSGIFGVDGVAQAGQLIAVYYDNGDGYDLVTATLTDADGRFTAKVYAEGNYRVCPYVNEEIFEIRDVSVGYEEERPKISTAINGTYTISGIEDYQTLELYKVTDNVVTSVYSETVAGASEYSVINLDSGVYRLKLVNNGTEKWYYLTIPEGALVDVTYYMTISGSVLDENGNAVIGSNVAVYDSNGELVGPETTILSDGGYSYSGLVEGKYKVVITSPNASEVLADRWTYQEDSYGVKYPDGLGSGKEWVWNINARLVSGRVTDQDGRPIKGAYVTFSPNSDIESHYMAVTDENGEYRLGLTDGRYGVTCKYFWDASHSFPGTGYTYIDLSGDMSGVDFSITRYDLTINTVRLADESVAPNASLAVYFEDGTLFWSGESDENGTVSIIVHPGNYRVSGAYEGAKTVTNIETVSDDKTVTLKFDSAVRISGTVKNPDGSVVPDGIVYYDNGAGCSGHVYTEDNGEYVILVGTEDLGQFDLYAVQGAYTGDTVSAMVSSDTRVDLTVGPKTGPTGETHTLSGVVTDEEGNRLQNAIVTMTWGNDKTNEAKTSTNSMGEYAFTVEDGTYYLTAEYEADNGNTYSSNAEAAAHVNGSDTVQNLRVLRRYNTTVYVVDADGAPVANAQVFYTGAESGQSETGADGTTVLYLSKGDYRFYAKTPSRESMTKSVSVQGETEIILELVNVGIAYEEPVTERNLLTLWGYVYGPDGYAIQGVQTDLYELNLETLEWSLKDSAMTNAEGYYEFPNLEDGTYRVDAKYVHTTQTEAVELAPTISGNLTDEWGNPLANNVVELYKGSDLIATYTTEPDGHYEFPGVEFGVEYQVKAADATGEPILDAAVRPEAAGVGIEGTTKDIGGHIVANAEVVIRDAEGNIAATTVTDETGRYSVTLDGASGSYTVEVTYPMSYEVPTATYERDTADRNAPYLKPSWYTISGYVHDEDGNAVSGATVILKDADKTELDRYITVDDGYYIFDHLEDGIYYVEVIFNGAPAREYKVDAESGTVSEEKPVTNISVTVRDFAKGTVTEPENGWVAGENSFTVESPLACAVLLESADGSLTRLSGACVEGNVYRFTASFEDGDAIAVVLKGDVDLNGRVNATDVTRLNQYLVSLYKGSKYLSYSADIDSNGRVNATDSTRISQFLVSLYKAKWDLG